MNKAVVTHPLIMKDLAEFSTLPNLVDVDGVRADFDWAEARALLDGLPGGRRLNIAYEAVDRHVRAVAPTEQRLRRAPKREVYSAAFFS
jgi:acetyl-CoA synthetase